MNVDAALAKVSRLAIDTAPIIYFVEQHPRYDAVVTDIFRRIDKGRLEAVTSVITLTEVLVHPVRLGRTDLHRQYSVLLNNSRHFILFDIDAAIAEQAAILRAQHNLRTPDALQIAVAVTAGCEAFLTNDKRLRSIPYLQIILLDDIAT